MINIKGEDSYFQQIKNKFNCSEHQECEKQAICLSEKHPFRSRFICIKCILQTKDLDIQSKTFLIKDLIEEPKKVFENILSNSKIPVIKEFCQDMNELKRFFLSFLEMLNQNLFIFQQQYDKLNDAVNSALENIVKEMKIDEFKHQLIEVLGKENHLRTKEYQQLEDALESMSSINKKFKDKFDIKNFQTIERGLMIDIDYFNVNIQRFCDNSLQYLKTIKDKFSQSLENEVIHTFPGLHEQISLGKQVKYQLLYQGTKNGMKNLLNFWQNHNQQYHLLLIMMANCGKQFGGYRPYYRFEQHGPNLVSFLFSYSNGRFSKYIKKNQQQQNQGIQSNLGLQIIQSNNSNDSPNLKQIFDFNNYEIQDTTLFEGRVVEAQIFKVQLLN